MRLRHLLAFAALLSLFFAFRPSQEEKSAQLTLPPSQDETAKPAVLQPKKAPQAEKAKVAASSDPMHDFTEWTKDYLATRNPDLISKGVKLAQERRPVFKELIKADPKTALAKAVPMVVRQKLPPEIVSLLEKRVNDIGALRVMQGVPMPGETLPTGATLTFREAEMKDGKTYRAYVYGRREPVVTWTANASLNGVAMDEAFAVNELPSRMLEVGEIPPADKPAVTDCPVSGKQVFEDATAITDVITEATPAVETATETLYFCSTMHIDVQNQTMIMGEGVSGGTLGFTGILPAAPTPSLGTVRVLVIPMSYADQNGTPSTEAALYNMLRDVSEFYSKASYGRLTLTGVVSPPVKLKHNEAWYVNRDTTNGGDISGTSLEHAESRDEARKLGFDSNDYDCTVVRHNGGPQSYGGLGGGSSVWLRGDGASTAAHEIGHCFGLAHANFWDTAGTSSIGNGANNEYGDSFDNMGSGPYPGGHYNAQAKSQIRWLPSNALQPVTQSGLYRIYAMDTGVLDPTRRYALNIVKDIQKTYWGEVRTLQDTNPWIKNGMILGWRYPNGTGSNIHLIDTTPGSPFLKEDAPISLGTTFSDTETGIHITTVAANDNPRYMDVRVNLGDYPTNNRPTLTLAASADVVPLNGTVTFTATASDADGDALAYGWQHFGDSAFKTVSPNAAVITRTFSTAGTYVVSCTVSDMKGGTTTRNQLITVGNGNSRYTISGRVTLLGAGLQDVVITANGANGVVTDADGYFTVPNLAANTYTLTPLLYGYSFGEVFNNSIVVGPNFSGANFEATAQSLVTVTALNPTANELAPVTTGTFRISRTGDISQDLIVNVNTLSGSAVKGTDYTILPDYATGALGFSTFTIPADAAYLDVMLTPSVDTTAEGPETAVLQLGPGNGYLVAMPSVATVTIADDDATVPKVSIAATTPDTAENGASSAVFTVSRTGTPSGDLVVNYAVSGSAASGADFTPLTGSVTILNGSASAVINLAALDDATSEQLETVRITLSTNAAYLIDPNANAATASIYDDDTQVVSVTATDSTAAEVDLTVPGAQADTGTFVITRSGDVAAPLTVYYAFAGTYNSGIMALHGVDFEALPGSVVIPAGQTQASITLLPRSDGIGEGTEQAVLYLGANATNYVLGSSSSATVTITDKASDLPYIDVVNTGSANEGGTAVFRITVRGGIGTGTLTVPYSFSGTASATDYTVSGTNNTLTGTTIALNNGATVTRDVTITNVNDTELEDLESLTITLGTSAAYQLYAPTISTTMWLRDNDNVNTVFVDAQVGTSGSVNSAESGTTTPLRFYVSRTGSTTAALTVNYSFSGTATQGVDYASALVINTPASGTAVALRDVWGVNDTNIWAVGDGGVILKWNGTAWSAQTSGTTANLLRVWGTDANNVWAVGASGTIRKWNGTAWAAQTSSTTNALNGIHGTSVTDVWAVGAGGTILRWNGTAWAAQTSGTTSTLNSVWAVNSTNVWAAGASGLIRFWNGNTWATQTSNTTSTLNALWGTDASNVWAAGASGTMRKWDGTNWTTQTVNTTNALTDLAGTDASNLVASASTNQAVFTANGGTMWTTHALSTSQTFNGIWRSSTGQAWAVGAAGSISNWNWDNNLALSGSILIPAGSLGVDLNLRVLEDLLSEGTETINFDFAAGSYSRSAGTTIYINDNDTNTQTIAFTNGSAIGLESAGTVNVPVTLASAATAPVTVEYAIDSGARNSSTTSNNTQPLPYWLRLVKTGTSFATYASNDGQTWTQFGTTQTLSGFTATNYLAGLCVCSGVDGTLGTAVFDNLTINGLSAGGSTGTVSSADIGAVAATGSYSVASDVYTVTGSGADIWNAADEFRYVWFPVTSSANCTITARITSQTNTTVWAKAGVMIRESSAAGARQAMCVATPGNGRAFQYRASTNGASTAVTNTAALLRPFWVRLQRAGDLFTSSISPDGNVWTTVGTPQTLVLAPELLTGLAVSARDDNTVTTATFDNVALTGSPLLQGRTVGFVNTQGTDSVAGGVYTLTAAGAQIGGTEDECHFLSAPVSGDFTLSARITSQSGGNAAAQAGLMVRESVNFRTRSLYIGSVANAGADFIYRSTAVTTAFGSGVDYTLPAGVLTFAVGDQTKNIPLTIINDTVTEAEDYVTLTLRNANGAQLASPSQFTYTIVDDDNPPANPYAGFAAATSTVLESAGTVNLTVSLSAPATAAGTVDYAVTGGTATGSGTDFTLASGTLSFAPGETTKTIPLSIVDDTTVDANETIIITLNNPTTLQLGSVTTHTATITDNDLPVVTLVATDPTASEAGLDQGEFTFYRTGDTSGTLTVNYAVSGTASSATDRQGVGTSVTFQPGFDYARRLVIPLDDAVSEATETTILTISGDPAYTVGTPSTATVNILDDDRSTVTIVANDSDASESAGNPGQFTVTRTAPTNVALTVNLTISGTATNATDYANVAATVAFAAGDVSKTVNVSPVDDAITEGDEQVTISLNTGTYDIGAQSFDNVTIADNDNPPVLFINSPAAQGPLIANGNGVILSATVSDDGAPNPVTQSWTQISGPGAATIESPTAATTAVTFSDPGTYILRITATDGQFTVSDQATVVVGSGLVAADWITQDLVPSSARRGQGVSFGGQFTVTGTGAGYSAQTTDRAHIMVRQVSGDGSIVARLTSQPTTGALSGITLRDSLSPGARRAVLGFVPGTGLQFRARTTVSANDTLVATQTGLTLPLWLKLQRNATTGEVTASYGSDGIAWTPIGTATAITMDSSAEYGLTTTSNNTAISATGVFDNVTLTPAPAGPALISEDYGASPAAPGSGSFDGTTYTIVGSTTGYYHGWQYYGDMVVTARLATFTSGASSASGGLRIAESMESGGQLHLGRMPQGAYSGYYWTSIAGGSGGGVPSSIAAGNWIKIVRRGNSLTGYRATHNSTTGGPNAWTQIGQPQTVIMTTPVWVGFYVNNASGVGTNTNTFTNLTIEPLHKAPVITATASGSFTPVTLDGTITDDSLPADFASLWTRRNGPTGITFANAILPDTTAVLTESGTFGLRLTADDTGTKSFFDLNFTAYTTPFAQWLDTTGAGNKNNLLAEANMDADGDGILNLMEYAIGTNGTVQNGSPQVVTLAPVSSQQYLRLSIPKNPVATDVSFVVEASSDLQNWSSAGLIIETDTTNQLVVRDNVAASTGVKRFMRVRVTR